MPPVAPSDPAPSSAFSNTTSTAGLDAQTTSSFQQALDDTRSAGQFPGVIARVVSPRGSWTGTSGTRGKSESEQPSATDATRIGSLTKTMTATILLQLAAEKKLSLTETIDKYVPGMPHGSTATLRWLADMSSGIPSYTADAGWQQQVFSNPDKAWTPQELVDVVKDKPADFEPGHGWAYSNTNYVLLGMVIEQVTGENIADVFQARLFDPLGMTHSVFPTTSQIPTPHLSGITDQGMLAEQTTDATNFSPTIAFTAGEVISTLEDLTTWGAALFTGTGILEPATQQERHDSIIRDIPPSYSETASYGIGIGDKDGWWGHDGAIPGYTTSLFHNYTSGTTVIVVVNSDVTFDGAAGPVGPAPAVFAALLGALAEP